MLIFFNFEQQCFSLLTNPELMKDENLSFPNNDPCDYRREDKNNLTCIEDGDLFQDTAKSTCKFSNDFCLGIKLFIDATHTDVHSNWMLDPIMFTFTFFKNKVTRSNDAWRTLGFITHTNHNSKAQNSRISSKQKLQDYHHQIRVILHSIKQCQDKGGFKWNLKYRDHVHQVRMIPVVLLIVGDAQGNHKFAGMYGKFFETSRVNHSCNCRWLDTDNPNIECTFVKQSTINKLCTDGNDVELGNISQHNISNAFNSVDIASHQAGINAMMPAEILHQLFLGMFQYVLEEFFQQFPPKALSRIDDFGVLVHHFGKHNSDRSIPSFNSRNGFTTITKKSGSDMIGTGLLCLLVLSLDFHKTILEGCAYGPTTRTMNTFQNLFQDLLIYAEWLCSDFFHKDLLDECHKNIQQLMLSIKKVVTRNSVNGLKLSKFHEMLHVCRDIRLLGPPDGFDGRPGESAHKFTKLNARKTQRRNNVFESQTCKRIYESEILQAFHCRRVMLDNPNLDFLSKNELNINDTNGPTPTYYIFMDDDLNLSSTAIKPNWKDSTTNTHLDVVRYVYKTLDFGRTIRIPCKTCLRIEVEEDHQGISVDKQNRIHLFRSNPLMNQQEWYDWAWIRWHDNGVESDVPGKIYCFVDLRSVNISEDELLQKGYCKSIYACIRSLKEHPTELFIGSKILFKSRFEDNPENYRLVKIDSITNSCYVIPNFYGLGSEDYDDWIVLKNRYKWGDHFT